MLRRQQAVRSPRPTIRDVAEAAGVSTATVSNVLRGTRFVGPAREKKVRDAIELLGYNPNWVAASLRSRRSGVIGIVVPDITNSFFAAIVRHIEELAAQSDYQILLADTQENPDREKERVLALIRRQVDGLILTPCRDPSETLEEIRKSKIPTVIVDRVEDGSEFDSVSSTNVEAAYDGCRHLISLGHRRITMLVSEPLLRNIAERIQGYRKALAEAGLSKFATVVVSGLSSEQAQRALRPILTANNRPSAIFAVTNFLALGALRAIWEAGLSVPETISLLAFDDCEWMTALRPFISVIRQPIEEIARTAWSALTDRQAGRRVEPLCWELPCTLLVRESTAGPRAASSVGSSKSIRQRRTGFSRAPRQREARVEDEVRRRRNQSQPVR
jgi:LacI family transcriptional regulator, galactose operon repressor